MIFFGFVMMLKCCIFYKWYLLTVYIYTTCTFV